MASDCRNMAETLKKKRKMERKVIWRKRILGLDMVTGM